MPAISERFVAAVMRDEGLASRVPCVYDDAGCSAPGVPASSAGTYVNLEHGLWLIVAALMPVEEGIAP